MTWKKSSYSANNGVCVEVGFGADSVAARDSEEPGGPALRFARPRWAGFLAAVKDGRFGG